jgi:anti-sigma factor RsiW
LKDITTANTMHTESPEDEILSYLRGELPEAARSAFETRCAQDPALRQQLAEAREAYAAMRQVRRHDLRSTLSRLDRRSSLATAMAWLAAALLAGLLILAFFAC